ncbi:LuxR C-terminal-related transcriptional regulator [Serratia fonticola]|uniref:LuxR C-terminal-related transcriptional regulator n=1 Tax=Serratia fonticola TaxID=47917 RepID=UPI0023551456|nr:LuxR C-terminal-related transcriptional regulator [Serratia fonticola]
MKNHSTTINLAIAACSPLVQLGISEFIKDLRLGYHCVLTSTALSGMREELMQVSATVLIAELGGNQEQLAGTAQWLLMLAEQCPWLNIVVYTTCRDAAILSMLRSYQQFSLIGQQESPSQLYSDMRTALIEGNICSPSIKACFDTGRIPTSSGLATLTNTERKVLSHLFAGLSLTDIATLFHRSIKTISAHKCNSMRKLGVRTDAELFQMSQADVERVTYRAGSSSGG